MLPAFLRCFLISLVLAFVASIVSTSMLMALPAGTLVALQETAASRGTQATSGEIDDDLLVVSTRAISGTERFARTFSHPWYWQFQLRSMATLFVTLMIGTVLAVVWNSRQQRRAGTP
jgi:hypothetical protein